MIKNIILDVGKVLVEWEPAMALRKLGVLDEAEQVVFNATVNSMEWLESDRSAISDEEILAGFISHAPEYEKEIRLFWNNIGMAIYQYDYVRSWIQSMKQNGYHVYILSNYGRWTYENTTEALSFLKDVDGALFSFEVHQVKPEPEIYQSLLAKYQLKAEECIFLDDREENIEEAKKQGMEGIIFTTYEKALEELKEYGIEC